MFSPNLQSINRRSSKRIWDQMNYPRTYELPPRTHGVPPRTDIMPPMPIMPPLGGGLPKGDDDSDDEGGSPFKFPKLFGGVDHDVYSEKNHIYFKTGVSRESIDKLATEIDHVNNKLAALKRKSAMGTFTPNPIYLHITTNGGDLLAGFYGYDKIKASPVPIHTIIEGSVASAGSLLSMAGKRRMMTPNSHLLIHQLRTGIIGTYEELVDEKHNCNQFMSKLVNLYHENCNGKMSKTKIREILKRDIFWDTKTAIKHGLVDSAFDPASDADPNDDE